MKNKNLYIVLAIATAAYFYYNKKKKKKGVVIVEPFQPLQGNEAEILQKKYITMPGELATVDTAKKIRQLPAVQKTLDTIKNKIFAKASAQVKAVENKIVKQVIAKKTQAKKTHTKTRAQKLGELGALYL